MQIMVMWLDPLNLLNANQRQHRHKIARTTALIRAAARTEAARQLNPCAHRVRIIATFGMLDQRRRDVGNLYPTIKACVDGIVDAGILKDDADRYVQGPDLRLGPLSADLTDRPRGARRIQITITLTDAETENTP